ncbi:MAG: tRNA (adenosine(37)-N6)-threonylcarbamoyltransferase complex ATPase subunit type 1 TsaE [Acidimicrobiales bacterium]
MEVRCGDLASTHRLAGAVASLLRPGDVVVLTGELGAGKTAFVQGLAAALGASGDVTSPTFTLLHHHATAGGFDLLHADLYRLDRLHEVADLGLDVAAEDGAVVVVEWGERGLPALGPEHLDVSVVEGAGGERMFSFFPVGERWEGREIPLARS